MQIALQNSPLPRSTTGFVGILITTVMLLALVVVATTASHPVLLLGLLSGAGVIYWLATRDYVLPVVPVILMVQWAQAGTAILYCEVAGISVNDLYGNWFVDDAIMLTAFGVAALGFGIWLPLRITCTDVTSSLSRTASQIDGGRLFYLYLVVVVATALIKYIAFDIPRLNQLVVAASGVKWVTFYFLAITTLSHPRYTVYLSIAIILEVLVGSLGFFSDFKTAFIYLLIAVMTQRHRLTPKIAIAGVLCLFVLVVMMVVWTSVKKDYRNYVNQGSRQQVVLVPTVQRLTTLGEMVVNLDNDDLKEGFGSFLKRVSYIEYFSHVLRNVPSNMPHQNGDLWRGAVEHVLMPRALFPDKAALPLDTVVTERYTQLRIVSQASRHTNIPIGYIGESYIDFGQGWMLIPIFVLGLVVGFVHKLLMAPGLEGLIASGVLTVGLLTMMLLETSLPKLIGGLFSSLIVLYSINLALRKHLIRYLNPG